jgi:hypothetical protein
MLSTAGFIGSLLMAVVSFFIGKFYAESERILQEKRQLYMHFLGLLPPLNDTYLETSEDEFLETLRPAVLDSPKLLFYADNLVVMAWSALYEKYCHAHQNLNALSPEQAPEFTALAKAQNDLILEMRRDAFRWSIFNHSAPSRVNAPQNPRL